MKNIKAAIAAFVLLALLPSAAFAQDKAETQFRKIATTLLFLQDYYVDTLDFEKLADKAVDAMISSLDPHTVFMSRQETEEADEPMNGEFDGIGIEFAIIKDTLTVQDVIAGGPSSKVGLAAGDKILKVDTVDIASKGLTNAKVRNLLRGRRGSRVTLEVLRRGEGINTYVITRGRIPIESVVAAYEAAPGVVYIKVSRFAANTAREVFDAIRSLGKRPEAVILDLRGNGGGLLSGALTIANFFLSKGQMIMFTEGANVPRTEETATGSGLFQEGPLVVMVDENSASASEIVAGAVQDWDRGTIVGRRTFGKGLVQRELKYVDGSALRITTARYYTPSGRTIQSPYEDGNSEKYYADHRDRYVRGESFSRDSIRLDESQKFTTLVKGRTVYGGGGIMPDIFVPRDTSYVSAFYSVLAARSIVQEFVNGYVDTRRAALLEKYPSWAELKDDASLDSVYAELVQYAKERNVPASDADVEKSSAEIILALKALIARALWDDNAYYRIINSGDEDYRVALEEVAALRAL